MPLFTSSSTTSTKRQTAKSLDGRLLCAAALAYEIREPYLSGAGFLSEPIQINKGVNSCLVGRTQDGIVIAFRGTTNDAWDWLQNTSAKLIVPSSTKSKIQLPNKGRVHKGFYNALYKTGWADEIQSALLKLLPSCSSSKTYKSSKRCKIYLTGHSKGGALASLYALELLHSPELPNPEYVCTFGSPRLGDAFLADYFQQNIRQTSYENQLDIIPFLPPSSSSRDSSKMESLMESVQKDGCKAANSCPRQTWEYAPIGTRKFLKGQIVHKVNPELDHERIREFEAKTILRLREFRQAHCSSCPDATNGCTGGYMKAIAPEICASVKSTLNEK